MQTDRIKELSRIMRLNLPKKVEPHIICAAGDQTVKAITDAIKDKREQLVCSFVDKTFVAVGNSAVEFNKEYCSQNNIAVLYSPASVGGGAVIFSAGDITFNFITNDLQSDWLIKTQKEICGYLAEKGLNAAVDKNDILIDGKKISGSSGGMRGGMRVESIFIAVVSSTDLIKKVCLKKTIKQPASLQEYGVTAQEIQDAVIGFTKRHMNESEHRKTESEKPYSKRTLKDVLYSNRNAEFASRKPSGKS